MKKTGFIALLLFVVTFAFTATPVLAADPEKWPEEKIESVYHSKAGSGGDIYLRALAHCFEKKLGVPVIVENITGAAGANAWNRVAHAKPDGYTILGVSSTIVSAPVQNHIPVNYESFDHVARMFIDPICIYVADNSPYHTLGELMEDAKKRPGELTFAGGTAGNIEFVAARELMKKAGCKVAIVPFEGGGDGAIAVLGGHVTAGVGEYAEMASSVKGGKIRILASFNKIEGTDIPTVAGAGYPEVVVEKMRGIFVPKGTPKVIIDKLATLMKEALDDPDFKAYYTANNMVPAFISGEAFTEILRKQTEQVKESLENKK